MNKKRIYTKPFMHIIVLSGQVVLLGASSTTLPKNKMVDDPDWKWDEEGAN